jgi:hypothetical protein
MAMPNTLSQLSLQELIGRECVYYEKACFHVAVVDVKVNGDELLLCLRQIKSIGFSPRDLGLFEVSCVSEYLTISPNSIQTSLISWTLVTNENATQQLVRVAATTVDFLELFTEYKRLRRIGFEA